MVGVVGSSPIAPTRHISITGCSGGQISLEDSQFIDSMIKPPMGGFFFAAALFLSPAGNGAKRRHADPCRERRQATAC
jgi:hypothetical protein